MRAGQERRPQPHTVLHHTVWRAVARVLAAGGGIGRLRRCRVGGRSAERSSTLTRPRATVRSLYCQCATGVCS